MAGKYFDEWQVGERIEHEIRRTVTETDNLMFMVMTQRAAAALGYRVCQGQRVRPDPRLKFVRL